MLAANTSACENLFKHVMASYKTNQTLFSNLYMRFPKKDKIRCSTVSKTFFGQGATAFVVGWFEERTCKIGVSGNPDSLIAFNICGSVHHAL